MIDQASKITLTSRTYINTSLGPAAKQICELTDYDKFLPCSSGVEACEAAVKLARRWGYTVKGVPDNHANILMANGVFWGRSITASGACSDPARSKLFGPFTPGFPLVDFGDAGLVEDYLKKDKNCVAVMLEPIQGEGGVVVPDDSYLADVKFLCEKYNTLLVCDEVQTGLGRTGKLLAQRWSLEPVGKKADITVLGKALSGGFGPASGILADRAVMDEIKVGEHGSTFGGNPLSMAIMRAALDVLVDEKLVENSLNMGSLLQAKFKELNSPMVRNVRGKGLMQCIEIERDSKVTGHDFCQILVNNRVLTKATKDYSCRFTPPLVINE